MSRFRLRIFKGRNANAPILPPVNLVAPSISGSAIVGQTLTIARGTYNPLANSYRYDMYYDSASTPFLNTDLTAYLLTSADLGHTIRVDELATNPAGTVRTASNSSAQVQDVTPPPPTPSPYYINTTQVYINSTVTVGASANNAQFASIASRAAAQHVLLTAEAARRNITI